MHRVPSASILLSVLALAGCSAEAEPSSPPAPAAQAAGGEEADAEEAAPAEPTPETTAQASDAKTSLGGATQSLGQTGRLVYKLVPPRNPKYAPYVDGVVRSKTMIDAVHLFNATLTFPKDVPIVVKECGRVNAFYSPSTHDVSLCFEFIDALHGAYAARMSDKTAAEKMAITSKVMAFFALHETGHAFLGENGIGVLGGEEDVVDDMSGIFFVASKQPEVPLHATSALVALQPTSSKYAGEHSFSKQRYFNMLCLIYGSSPSKYPMLVGSEAESKLPQDRAVRCTGEWADKTSALRDLVGPYVRR
jgi:hypothetical protein